jgi:hypothetical protein
MGKGKPQSLIAKGFAKGPSAKVCALILNYAPTADRCAARVFVVHKSGAK